MADDADIMTDILPSVVQAIADVLGTPLIITSVRGVPLSKWQFPAGLVQKLPDLDLSIPPSPSGFRATVLGQEGSRRLRIPFTFADSPYAIQSASLPAGFIWTAPTFEPQSVPGQIMTSSGTAIELLEVFVSSVMRSVAAARRDSIPLTELTIENIRRIGIALATKIAPIPQGTPFFSLKGTPGIDYFVRWSQADPQSSGSSQSDELTDVFQDITRDLPGSFNIMSLNGDFIITASHFDTFCKIARRTHGRQCFFSDLDVLISSAFLPAQRDAHTARCHAGLLEVFSPIRVDGLLVGVVFGGQLSESANMPQAMDYIASTHLERGDILAVPRSDLATTSGGVVAGLARLVGMLFDRLCSAKNEAELLETILTARSSDSISIMNRACEAAKDYLSVRECSAFTLKGDMLHLASTTATHIYQRTTPNGSAIRQPAHDLIGKAFYRLGEGLTGGVAKTGQSEYVLKVNARQGWLGRCSESEPASQCIVCPIKHPHDQRVLGVLRGVRPEGYVPLSASQQKLFATFANHVGLVLDASSLALAEAQGFRETADRLQTLLAFAAHEIQAPMHNILSIISAFQHPLDSDKRTELYKRVRDEGFRLKRHISNYLARGILGKEEPTYNFAITRVGSLVIDCTERFIGAAAARGIRINVDPSLSQLPDICADKEKLEQVFANLIDNAVKYSFTDSVIEITAREKASTIVVSIKDFGLGIPHAAQRQIFEGYSRAVEDKTRFKPGTGLGLMIARRIVLRHRGDIQVHSDPVFGDKTRLAKNEGFDTTFRVVLPRDLQPGDLR